MRCHASCLPTLSGAKETGIRAPGRPQRSEGQGLLKGIAALGYSRQQLAALAEGSDALDALLLR